MIRLNVKVWVHALLILIRGRHVPGSALNEGVVELFQRTFTCCQRASITRGGRITYGRLLTVSGIEVVDVGIPEGTAGHGVTTDTNARDGPSSAKSQ